MATILVMAACSPSPPRGQQALGYEAPHSLTLHGDKLARIVNGLPQSSPQRQPLKDGTVTLEELNQAWRHLASCVRAAGVAVSDPVLSPITQTEYLYTYRRRDETTSGQSPTSSQSRTSSPVVADAADDRAVHACEDAYWTPLSLVYAANTPQHLSDPLRRFMTGCMTEAHYATSRTTTFDDLVRNVAGQVDRGRLQRANACLDQGVAKLYPSLPYFPRP